MASPGFDATARDKPNCPDWDAKCVDWVKNGEAVSPTDYGVRG